MAEKRMFSLKIIDSDNFLSLSLSSQALYFHLAMRADDDGFVDNANTILRVIDASHEDLNALWEKEYIIQFEDVVVIRHWKMHNTLKMDRYKPTIYQKEKARLKEVNKVYYVKVIDEATVPPNDMEKSQESTVTVPASESSEQESMATVPASKSNSQGKTSTETNWNQAGTKLEPEWNRNGTKLEPQDRSDKVRIDKNRVGSRVVNYIINNNIRQSGDSELVETTAVTPEGNEKNVGGESKVIVPTTAIPEGKDNHNVRGNLSEDNKATVPAYCNSPTLEEVIRYAEIKKLGNVDVEKFFEYYSSQGWKDKNGRPLNWRLKMRDWQKSERKFVKNGNPFLDLMKDGVV